eukprot:s4161_g1.t1
MEDGFPARQRQNPDWLMDVDYIACSDAVLPDHLDSEEISVKGNPITVFHLPVTQNGQEGTIYILCCPDMIQGANPHPPSGWAELSYFPDDLQKTVLCGQHLVRITEGQHHLVHESGIVVYGTNKRRRSKLARLLAGEAWFESRKKITSFEHEHTTVSFETIPFSSCGDLGYQEGPKAPDYLDLPLAQRATALSLCLGALVDLHGKLHTELHSLEEQRILYPEVQEALTTASQAMLAAMTQLKDRVEDMNAIVERQRIQLIGASQRILPSPTLSIRNLRRHDQSQENHDSQPSHGEAPEEESVIQSAAGTDTNPLALVLAPAPCAKARTNPSCSLVPKNPSSREGLENSRPRMSIVERSLLFIARAESAPERS